jgi:hypothetical protein
MTEMTPALRAALREFASRLRGLGKLAEAVEALLVESESSAGVGADRLSEPVRVGAIALVTKDPDGSHRGLARHDFDPPLEGTMTGWPERSPVVRFEFPRVTLVVPKDHSGVCDLLAMYDAEGREIGVFDFAPRAAAPGEEVSLRELEFRLS